MTQRPGHPLGIEAEQLPGRRRRAENPAGRGDVPAPAVMRRHHRVADPAFGFDAEDQRMQQIGAGDLAQFGQREQAGHHRRRRMDHRRQVRIVVFEHIGADRVQEGGVQRVRPLVAADDARLRRAEIGPEHMRCQAHRLVLAAAQRAADEI
jgi:hypothetical protein